MPEPKPLPVADELGTVFARMSGLLLSQETVGTALRLVTSLARETLPHSMGAGITLVDPAGHRTTAAGTDPIVKEADALQYELDEGPCLTAWREQSVVRVDDTATEQRWPHWTVQVVPLGMRAVLSAPLVAGENLLGAIKVYSDTAGAFDARDEFVLSMFAAQAAILVANMQSIEAARSLSDDLKSALRAREVIAMAKGVLMSRDGADEGTALTTLARLAAQRNTTLRDTAETTVRSALRERRPR
ncbi:MAG: GAF domain-containing protein [Jatrophihabitans sp.]|uniref:GAF domain-containing protein n=1 Tax=Jatrophihabitans sp. TaxID=1932789 RepID=UPI003916ACB6